jgi:hypothetical protein
MFHVKHFRITPIKSTILLDYYFLYLSVQEKTQPTILQTAFLYELLNIYSIISLIKEK